MQYLIVPDRKFGGFTRNCCVLFEIAVPPGLKE